MNPYEPPQPIAFKPWQPPDSLEPIVLRFPNTAEQMLQSLDRFRSLKSSSNGVMRFLIMLTGLLPIVIFLGIYLVFAMAPSGFPGPAWRTMVFGIPAPFWMVILALLWSMSGLLFRWRLRRTIARSQDFGGDVTFTLAEDGVQVTYPNCESKLTWNAFTQVAIFDDGALLLQAHGFYWLLYRAIEGDFGQERMVDLLQAKVPKYIDRRKSKAV